MNLSSLIGIFLGVAVMYYALTGTSSNLSFFLNEHGILIVIGGTLAAACISFPILQVLKLTKVFFSRVIFGSRIDFESVITEILDLQKRRSTGGGAIGEAAASLKHPFL